MAQQRPKARTAKFIEWQQPSFPVGQFRQLLQKGLPSMGNSTSYSNHYFSVKTSKLQLLGQSKNLIGD